MKKRTPVSKIMTKEVETVNLTNTIRDAQKLFEDKGIHHLPVVSGSKVIGIVSKSDLAKVSFISNYSEGQIDTSLYDILKLEQIMTKTLTSIQKEDTIKKAAEVLCENEFQALPVLEGDDLAGILSTRDLLKYLVDQF